MASGSDFVEFLERDISIEILRCLEDPSDLRRASAVSTSWRRLVIENGLCKLLCLQMFPQLSDVHSARAKLLTRESMICSLNCLMSMAFYNARTDDALTLEHSIYLSLARSLTSSKLRLLVSDAISASSTDHFYEGIENTLLPGDEVNGESSYWSSIGESDPQVPETLVYKLVSDLCVITKILVQPHEGL